ncbi:hypothetical protein COX69_00930 [Candidatus Falkowbacteria bacterium CG_4_10_14_0_2_um_filter_48_10]|uniref:Ribose-phosphate diphosphokinase n=1 Tax=Candidatus Falkowbacteria bacterium CG23_combo_of_CG06-09_8_20_14_all_49_15 TaxID=1974572 RepID=A0A2G9ZK66_9BACT|nr:MAG: hypothetical protein COX22_03700 [Candidatus Falkowbacteria bacterium CG23_combo_of_CG06-09_8_20_14_all_49_15]PJA08998.1 MAG: hypothetical protein COX69_00930 [Candidatus Falkowbacteria bacterium CG_4_10_14_0_2_um_filter_48_10]
MPDQEINLRLADSEIERLLVSDTIPLREEARQCPKIVQVSIADILAESIRRCYNAESVSRLFA